jgi:hypothetical protein
LASVAESGRTCRARLTLPVMSENAFQKISDDLAALRERLAKAEVDLAQVKGFVTAQRQMIEIFERGNRDTALARELLATLEALQKVHADHRDDLIKRLEGASA